MQGIARTAVILVGIAGLSVGARLAFAQSDSASARWQASPRQVVRDSAYVMTNAGRIREAITVLAGWIHENPRDTAVALDLARLKARVRDWEGSIAQYTALIEQHRSAAFLFERGQTYLWSGDSRRGEADLLAADALEPGVAIRRQLGDHYRWQGDLARSAAWYRLALRSAPGDTGVREGMRLLDRAIDARLLTPGELAAGDLGTGMSAVSDNAGYDMYSLRVGQAVALPAAATVLTASGEVRSASRTTIATGSGHVDAWGADAFVSSRAGLSKWTASVGVLDHGNQRALIRGSLSADGFIGSARLRASVRRLPAYEVLWSPGLLGLTPAPGDRLMTATQGQAGLSLPFTRTGEIWMMAEYVAVSDDNERAAFQLAVRRRVAGPLSLIWSGSVMSYAEQTALYYSPGRYLSQSLGAELSRYHEQGLSWSLRVSPGYAWMREPAGTLGGDGATQDVSAFQMNGSVELGYRRGGWDLLVSTGHSSGREGGYRSTNALLHLRRAW